MMGLAMTVMVYAQAAQDTTTKDMKKDHITMTDGKLWQVKSGNNTEVLADITLDNGTIVTKDGNVKTKDGKSEMLKDGDCVWMDGKITHKDAKKKDGKPSGG